MKHGQNKERCAKPRTGLYGHTKHDSAFPLSCTNLSVINQPKQLEIQLGLSLHKHKENHPLSNPGRVQKAPAQTRQGGL